MDGFVCGIKMIPIFGKITYSKNTIYYEKITVTHDDDGNDVCL